MFCPAKACGSLLFPSFMPSNCLDHCCSHSLGGSYSFGPCPWACDLMPPWSCPSAESCQHLPGSGELLAFLLKEGTMGFTCKDCPSEQLNDKDCLNLTPSNAAQSKLHNIPIHHLKSATSYCGFEDWVSLCLRVAGLPNIMEMQLD